MSFWLLLDEHCAPFLRFIEPFLQFVLDGRKTVELRRRFTNSEVIGSLAFIYSTSPVRELVGYARIRDVRRLGVKDRPLVRFASGSSGCEGGRLWSSTIA